MLVTAKTVGTSYRLITLNALALTLALFLTACHPQQTSEPSASGIIPTASESASLQRDTSNLKSPFAPELASATMAMRDISNFNDLLDRYPKAQQAKIKTWFASRAPNSMHFRFNAQWQWMRKHGYPTPDDVLHASTMSELQLRELAANGDTKANFFYLARLVDSYGQMAETSGPSGQHQEQLQAETTASMDRALASGSAFSGYMFIDYYTALHGKDAAGVATAAGLTWVDTLGDSSGPFHNQQMAMGFPGVSGVHAAEVYFDMFATAARMNPYFMNAYDSRGERRLPLRQ